MGFAPMPDGSGWALSDQGNVIVVTHESALAFARAVFDEDSKTSVEQYVARRVAEMEALEAARADYESGPEAWQP
jgi:hypothetical protein